MTGYPYDQAVGTPSTAGGRLLCGYPLGDDVTCRNSAPCVVHRDRDLSAAADIPASDPARGLVAAIKRTRRVPLDPPSASLTPPTEAVTEEIPVVDLHGALKDDTQPWSVRSRLTTSLGRPSLATRLADALPPILGAELADRLDTLITQALTEQEAQITQELSDRYHEARARIDADAAKKLQEVHDERFRGHSRFN